MFQYFMFPWSKKKDWNASFIVEVCENIFQTNLHQICRNLIWSNNLPAVYIMINLKWLKAYIYWGYNISDNRCASPIL